MQKKLSTKSWLIDSTVSIRKAALLGLILYCLLVLSYLNGGREFVYNRVINPIQFKLRNQSGSFSPLNPHIKIFAVDQKTMNEVRSEQVTVSDWIVLFRAIAKSHPKAIYIDKMFSLPLSTDPMIIKEFQEVLRAAAPVTAAAVFSPVQLPSMTQMSLKGKMATPISKISITPGFVYGPRAEILEAVSHIGHTNYSDDGYVKPLIRISDTEAIPHWGLSSIEGFSAQNGQLSIHETPIPLNDQGATLINLATPENYWQHTYSLINVLKRARLDQKINEINSEDYVVLLTNMYQGTTAYKSTPAGSIPGAFVMIEVINSALNGTWIRSFSGELGYLALFCFVGCYLGWGLGGLWFWPSLLLIEGLLMSLGYFAFKIYSFHLPWGYPAAGLFLSAIVLYAEKTRIMSVNAKVVQISLEGMVGPQKLKQLLSLKSRLSLPPQNQVLTILFIDIVGFSVAAERESPSVIFGHLRTILSHISEIVHESGGIIDRSLGDGLLCFFGYKYESDGTEDDRHAEKALNCALRIQREILNKDLQALKDGSIIFPLRIGVNTGEVYIGDLGGKNRIDFTIIGHAVNFA